MTAEERFWKYVDIDVTTGCFNWIGGKTRGNYGEFNYNKKPQRVHRVSYIIHYGDIPDGLHVLHTCDNPSCVNPLHLFLGTNQDNMTDKCNKGRWKGRGCNLSQIDRDEIIRIYKEDQSITQYELAEIFAVTQGTINNILNNKVL